MLFLALLRAGGAGGGGGGVLRAGGAGGAGAALKVLGGLEPAGAGGRGGRAFLGRGGRGGGTGRGFFPAAEGVGGSAGGTEPLSELTLALDFCFKINLGFEEDGVTGAAGCSGGISIKSSFFAFFFPPGMNLLSKDMLFAKTGLLRSLLLEVGVSATGTSSSSSLSMAVLKDKCLNHLLY